MGPMLEKREKHASRAMDALWNLRLRCPGLSQTTLHVYKIQYNKVRSSIGFEGFGLHTAAAGRLLGIQGTHYVL